MRLMSCRSVEVGPGNETNELFVCGSGAWE